jgi:hypothetical protein
VRDGPGELNKGESCRPRELTLGFGRLRGSTGVLRSAQSSRDESPGAELAAGDGPEVAARKDGSTSASPEGREERHCQHRANCRLPW